MNRAGLLAVAPAAASRPAGGWTALVWLVAFAAALWPHWRWAAARLADGSDDPLGLAALAVLAVAVVRLAPRLAEEPSPRWLAAATALAFVAALATLAAPPLAAALLAALAMAAALRAFVPARTPTLALAGLAALALPIVSSMQFYAGFPLRVVTAEASTWLLGVLGFDAARSGSAMVVDGRLVIVDAPCSGVQMVWMAYFCACTVAWWAGLPDRRFLVRVAGVGAIVLVGNVVRNSILVGLEAGTAAPAPWLHQAVGLVVLGGVCLAVVALVGRGERASAGTAPTEPAPTEPAPTDRPFADRAPVDPAALPAPWRGPLAVVLVACALAPIAAQVARGGHAERPLAPGAEWPRQWQGRPLRPLALGDVEARFASQFPGRIARLTDDRSVIVWREVLSPTRMLHPAADCYRGLGYRIDDARLERDADGALWRSFVASRPGRRVRVAERIVDARGGSYTDASAWFWAAELGRSPGPWQALTVATPLGSPA
ncbi:MAG: exosortase Q [Caldimonas sp.]